MQSTLIFISDITDLDIIPKDLLYSNDVKLFSFDFQVHHEFESRKIKHEIADNLLTQEERLKIFDKATEFRNWYSNLPSNDCTVDGINILKLFDSHEFHSFLIPYLINLVLIKRIIENEHPKKIITTTLISKLVESVIKKNNVETIFFQNTLKNKLFWDKITIKYNLGKIPLTFNLSHKTYLKIKNFLEFSFNKIYHFSFDMKQQNKKSILFLEFNPEPFSKLLEEMKNFDGNVILVNQRRTPIWSKKSINAIKNSKCKILKLENLLSDSEKQEIQFLEEKLSKKLKILWENSEFFNDFFKIEDCSFWDAIKGLMIQTYSERLLRYILLIKNIKKVFETLDIRCIVSLNEVGETEKAFLEINNNKIPSIVLEHGFLERIPKTKRFDVIGDYVNFKDRIAVWGNIKKDWLTTEHNIDSSRIIVTGSPRHDIYFNSKIKKSNSKTKTLLLAPNPLSVISGLSSTELKLRFIKVIKEVFTVVNKLDNVRLIVKLHPISLQHNEEIKSLIKELDSSIPIFLWTSVIDAINKSDAVLVISPEIYGTSTMLLESMILGKPTMNVYFDSQIPEYGHVKDKSILTITDNCDLESNLKKILLDEEFQKNLCNNADIFVKKFMSNPGTASKEFTSTLQSF